MACHHMMSVAACAGEIRATAARAARYKNLEFNFTVETL
jgi:hypothetical protein